MFQIRKNQLDTKLDKNLKNVLQNHQPADMKIFDNEDNHIDSREKKGKKKLKNNINISLTDLYLYVIIIICMYW